MKLRRFLVKAAPALIVGILVLALGLLFFELRKYRYRDILAQLGSYPLSVLLLVVGVTAASYLLLTLYDTLAFRFVRERLSYPKIALTSFLSYVFSYNIGLSIFGSSAVRFRFYGAWGLSPAKTARVIGFCYFTYWVGLAFMGGLVLLIRPLSVPEGIPFPARDLAVIGAALLGSVLVYLAITLFRSGKPLRLRSLEIALPSFPLALAQILIASADWLLAGFVLYLLLPQGAVSFFSFLAVFISAQLLAAVSHVPGGIGVIETVMLFGLAESVPGHVLIGALLAYRGVYYLLPLALAGALFFLREILQKKNFVFSFASGIGRLFPDMMPVFLSIGTFLSGGVLLLSGFTPVEVERFRFLNVLFPFSVMELSHFAASIVGLFLLVLAQALYSRLDAAFYFSLIFLFLGAVLSLLKELDYEAALVLFVVFLFLLPSHRFFYRKARIFSEYFSPLWTAGVLGLLAFCLWVGFFVYKDLVLAGYPNWSFMETQDYSRFLRAGLGVCAAVGIIGFKILFSPARKRQMQVTLKDCRRDVERMAAASASTGVFWAFTEKKYYFFNEDRSAFIMYEIVDETWVALGEPLGDPGKFRDLIWRFHEDGNRAKARVLFLRIPEGRFPLYSELGLPVLACGTEVFASLKDYSPLDRTGDLLLDRMEREGFSFDILPSKAEKDPAGEASIGKFPVAVVYKEGKALAFADLWATSGKEELAIAGSGVQSPTPASPEIKEYLLWKILYWGRARGFGLFKLGFLLPASEEAVAVRYYRTSGFFAAAPGLEDFAVKAGFLRRACYLAANGRFVFEGA